METHSSQTSATPNEISVGPVAGGDRQAVDQACQRLDERREALKQRLGEVSVTSDLLREFREP